MNALLRAAVDVQQFCHSRGWRCCVIGGLAVLRWGEPRQTRDVDLTLVTGLGGEERFIDPLLARYRPRIPEARQLALEHRVVLVETSDGVPLDISLAGLPYEARIVDRASPFTAGEEATVDTCSAEDLVVLKAFADRPQDWIDIESVLVRQGAAIDRRLIMDELRPLLQLKDDDSTEPRLLVLFRRHPAVTPPV